jgi:threonyl-tRNA synthetase
MNLDMAGYEFVATLEEEQEGHESENEISTTVYLNASKTSYVQVEQSSENDDKVKEESFEYEVWDRGVLVKNFEIETEISGNRSDIETEINNNSYKVELLDEQGKTIFKFLKEKDLNDSIKFEKVKTTDPQTGNVIISYLEVL